jgi:hypothetical protein
VDSYEIDSVLNAVEVRIAFGNVPDLNGTGYWPAVQAIKRDPVLTEQFADRIGAIDDATFNAWARLVLPLWAGTALAVIGSLIGLVLIGASEFVPSWNGIVFLLGTGVLIGTTHGLGHIVVGTIGGIQFTAWFIGRGRPQPGVKTDYATYLYATPRSRAWMHAAGAIVTKAIPFVLIPVSVLMPAIPTWVPLTLLGLGIIQIVTDVAWSTKSSDWAKFRREMAFDQGRAVSP